MGTTLRSVVRASTVNRSKVLVMAMAVLTASCSEQACETLLLRSAVSPSGLLEARIYSSNCGATVATRHYVRVSAAGGQGKADALILDADRVEDLRVQWLMDKHLSITYKSARIFEFRGYAYLKDASGTATEISISEERRGAPGL